MVKEVLLTMSRQLFFLSANVRPNLLVQIREQEGYRCSKDDFQFERRRQLGQHAATLIT